MGTDSVHLFITYLKIQVTVVDLLIGEKKIVIQPGFNCKTSDNILQGGEGWGKRVEVAISQEFTGTKVGVASKVPRLT